MARFCTLFSGSSGNSTYIGCGAGGVLIDAGVSAKAITAALSEHDIEMSTICAIFVTHEHSDHIQGLKALASRHNIPVYTSAGTLGALEKAEKLCAKYEAFEIDSQGTEVAGMMITPFETSHDCSQSMGFLFQMPDDRKIAVCTDLGYVSDQVRQSLAGCDLVMIESNHDVMMLQNGGYPYYLKRRILSEVGHLSNASCAQELPFLLESGTTRIVLAHLSRENNHPEVALACARSALCGLELAEGRDYLLSAAAPKGGRMMVI